MPVCKKCGKSRSLVKDEVKVDEHNKLIRMHFVPCKGSKKTQEVKDGAKPEPCGSTEYNTGKVDKAKAYALAKEKSKSEDDISKYSVVENPKLDRSELSQLFTAKLQWIATLDNEADQAAETQKLKDALDMPDEPTHDVVEEEATPDADQA